MAAQDIKLPLIDLGGYINSNCPEDNEQVIGQVRDACHLYGFFQVKGHGVAPTLQNAQFQSLNNLFNMPREEKLKLSFLESPCRRGYEASGMSIREGDVLPDSNEVRLACIQSGTSRSNDIYNKHST